MASLFALAACSEDVYQEIDEQNKESESQYSTNSFNDDDSGYYDPGAANTDDHPGISYVSPWDVWARKDYNIPYTFRNGAENSIYELEFTAYIGLAYYDDIDDGIYRDPEQGYAVVTNLANGNYPNLYQNNQEIGNLIAALPLKLDGTTLAESEMSIGENGNHCPVTGNNLMNWNPNQKYFDIASNGATSQEVQLLAEYGKVFFYKVTATNRNTGEFLDFGFVQLENKTLNSGSIPWWVSTNVNAFSPVTAAPVPLHYYYNTTGGAGTQWAGPMSPPNSNKCDSREIEFPYYGNKPFIKTEFDPTNGPVTLKYEVSQGANLWRSSSPHLTLTY